MIGNHHLGASQESDGVRWHFDIHAKTGRPAQDACVSSTPPCPGLCSASVRPCARTSLICAHFTSDLVSTEDAASAYAKQWSCHLTAPELLKYGKLYVSRVRSKKLLQCSVCCSHSLFSGCIYRSGHHHKRVRHFDRGHRSVFV